MCEFVYECVHVSAGTKKKAEDPSGTGVTGGREMPNVGARNRTWEEQCVFSTTEPSLSTPKVFLGRVL